ncbi:MAG: tetratricopeptide repeat protein [Actinomycetota bacterium]|nr:tetratricopeptide repeat protein [Actinomycetota bacterium]
MRTRIAIGGLAAAIIAGAVLLGGVLAGSRETASARSTAATVPNLFGDFSAGNTASLVLQLQSGLRARPNEAKTNALLGLAYQQRARETGDPSYYAKSDGVLRRALRTEPSNLLATSALGSLALSRHRFREALALGRRAVALSPSTARSHGVVGDALVELGRYDEAFAAFDRMSTLRPSLSAYARISYARELLGDFVGAVQAMRLALDAAVAQPEALAWTHVQLGKLFFGHGRVRAADREFRLALAAFPGYVYAYDQLAQVEAARGNLRRSIALERRAVDVVPLPQFVTALRDLYDVTGRKRQARRQDALIGTIQRLLTANGVKTDLEIALFDVDHAVRLPQALELARAGYRDRPSIDGDDVLAWALARNGRCVDALHFSKRALRLGTLDATKFFHRGMIERCLGNGAEAKMWFRRALSLNPHFSVLWAPVARRYSA